MKIRMRPGTKSTNAKRAREAFGDAEEKEMLIQLCIDDYSQHMGGVDIADQLSYYDTQLTSFRTTDNAHPSFRTTDNTHTHTSFRAWWSMLFWASDAMSPIPISPSRNASDTQRVQTAGCQVSYFSRKNPPHTV